MRNDVTLFKTDCIGTNKDHFHSFNLRLRVGQHMRKL